METSHSHHLEIHSTSLLSRLKPEIKIAATFVIVLSIAFLSLENNISIIVQTFVVLLFIYLSKIKASTSVSYTHLTLPTSPHV